MKKRYARILAATLSAAMVFTSAPASVFDTGVIEAQAATIAYSTNKLVEDELKRALTVSSVKDTMTVTYDGSTTTGASESDSPSMAKNLSDALEGVMAHDSNGDAVVVTVAVTGGAKTAAGTYDIKIGVTSGTDEGAVVDYPAKLVIEKDTPVSGTNYQAIPTKLYYVYGTTDVYATDSADSDYKIGTGTYADKWTVDTASMTALKAAKAGAKVDVTIKQEINTTNVDPDYDPANYDFVNNVPGYVPYTASSGYIATTLTVTVAKATAVAGADDCFNANNIPEGVTYTWGDKEPKLVFGNSATEKGKAGWTAKLLESATGKDANEDIAVVVESVVVDDSNVTPDATITSGDDNAGPETYAYDATSKKYSKRYTGASKINIDPKPINVADVEWPTALASGEKVTFAVANNAAELKKVKLAETASSQYGTFYLVGSATKAGSTAFTVEFELNDNCTAGTALGDWAFSVKTLSGEPGNKKITVDVQNTVVKTADITVKYQVANEGKKFEYGDTYQDVQDVLDFAAGVGNYTLCDAQLTDTLPVGNSKIVYEYALSDEDAKGTKLENGQTSMKFELPVVVNVPTISFDVNDTQGGFPVAPNTTKETLTVDTANVNILDSTGASCSNETAMQTKIAGNVSFGYQWYKNGKAIAGATEASLDVPRNVIGINEYYCVVTPTIKTGTPASVSKAIKEILTAASYKTDVIEAVVSNTSIAFSGTATSGSVTYGDVELDLIATATLADSAYKIESATWYYVDDSDKTKTKHALTGKLNKDAVPPTSTIAFPEGLDAGSYTFTCEVTTKDGDGNVDVSKDSTTIVIAKKKLPTAINSGTDVFVAPTIAAADAEVVYGTTVSDIKFTSPYKYSDQYGTYVLEETPLTVAASPVTLKARFIPTAATIKNYKCQDGTAIKAYNTTQNITQTITVTRATLKIAAPEVTVAVNGTLADANTLQPIVTGLVGNETLKSIGGIASIAYDKDKVASLAKEGVIDDAVVLTIKKENGGNYDTLTKATAGTFFANYKVEFVDKAAVVVKAAAPVAPSVKPTPAPVKQSVAAKAKAVKSKATVKVGKKYTLKLKYAAGKKSTVKKVKWTSSKKSVATVSSKGKVTAKKAGKATIYARVYFKDGSMKKIKFTVTVK